jgi:hypothetical protein
MSARRGWLALAVLCLACLVSAARADAGVVKGTYTEDSVSVSPMDPQDGLAGCVGYAGLIYEQRHGAWKLRIGKQDTHVEGTVHARLRIFPRAGRPGVTYTGSYVEHDVGRVVPGPDGDLGHPMLMFQLRAQATGDDGSTFRMHMIGQQQVDLRTGQVRRDRYTMRCTVS